MPFIQVSRRIGNTSLAIQDEEGSKGNPYDLTGGDEIEFAVNQGKITLNTCNIRSIYIYLMLQ